MKYKFHQGYTLIEMIVFIVVVGILMNTLLIGANMALRTAPNTQYQWAALQTARQCMEWYIGQKKFNGYAALVCPSTPSTVMCTPPSGFAVSANITCTTRNSDAAYKTITVTVSGLAAASLTAQVGDY